MLVEILTFILLLVGLALLIKMSDLFVEAAVSIAEILGVKEFIIGITIVAIGTSLPEVISNMVAAKDGLTDLVIGSVIGSNVANTALILGVISVMSPIALKKSVFGRESIIVIITSFILLLLSIIGVINLLYAIVLLLLYISYSVYIVYIHLKDKKRFLSVVPKRPVFSMRKAIIVLIISSTGLWLGAQVTVKNASSLALLMGIPDEVIASTVLAVGTSLPELSVSIKGIIKNKKDLAIGNILGSNIANILLVLGLSGVITDIIIVKAQILFVSLMLFIACFVSWHIHNKDFLTKKQGLLLIFMYAVFIAFEIIYAY